VQGGIVILKMYWRIDLGHDAPRRSGTRFGVIDSLRLGYQGCLERVADGRGAKTLKITGEFR
jgi:hypothetical protein